MAKTSFDVLFLGGGPGGYVGAIRAAQLGLDAAVVEKDKLGGVCLNWGCIPTKALLRTAELYTNIKHAEEFGLQVGEISFDVAKVVQRSRKVARKLNSGVKHLLKKNGVVVFEGHGSLNGKHQVRVTENGSIIANLTSKNIILATGARPRLLPGIEPDGELVWTYKEAMVPKTIPGSLLVIGSGAIGIEFASFYNALGANVTVVELLDRVVPVEDIEISELARKSFEKKGITIYTGASVSEIEKDKGRVIATIEKEGNTKTLQVDRVVLAVGIVGNVEDIGLNKANIKVEKSHVVTSSYCETGEPGVYAIGDLTGPPWLAHKASHEAVICVEKIAGLKDIHPLDSARIPGCTYSNPQIASVGLTEEAAREAGHEVKVGRFPFAGNGKAMAMGETEGLVKTVFDTKTGELLGAHMLGAEVTELIQGYSIAKTLETTEQELLRAIFPHPTLSEMMHEAVLDAYDRAVHI